MERGRIILTGNQWRNFLKVSCWIRFKDLVLEFSRYLISFTVILLSMILDWKVSTLKADVFNRRRTDFQPRLLCEEDLEIIIRNVDGN